MNKRYNIKRLYAISATVSLIGGFLFALLGIGLLIFSPIGKWFSIIIILSGIFALFQGKTVVSNEINVNEDYVYVKKGALFKSEEKKLLYNEIISVRGNNGGGVFFETKMGIINLAYIDGAVDCANLINKRLENGKFDDSDFSSVNKVDSIIEKDSASDREFLKRIDEFSNRTIRENEHRCNHCGCIQSKTIQRCLKCGQMIANNDDTDSYSK